MNPIEEFERYLVENGIAPKTIESYVGDVKGFCVYLKGMGVEQTTDLKRFYVSSYKNHLMENKYAVATINKKINSLQAFNLFLIDRKLTMEQVVTLRKDRIKVAAGTEGEVEVFSGQEVNQLLFFVKDGSKVNLRNHLIVNEQRSRTKTLSIRCEKAWRSNSVSICTCTNSSRPFVPYSSRKGCSLHRLLRSLVMYTTASD